MAIGPIGGISSPLPKFVPTTTGLVSMVALRGLKSPLPKFTLPSTAWPMPAGITLGPVKPLPGGGGSGGGTVGFPIDSG